MNELGVSWGDLGTYSDIEEALKNADESFYKDLKPILESLKGFDQSDWSILTMSIQQYLCEHPVRKNLIKMVADKKLMEVSPIRMEVTETMLANFMHVNDSVVRKINS
jgi:hypothetical protein